MGNAVRLANRDADRSKGASQPLFRVPRGGNGIVTQATDSGKKIHISEKCESSQVKDWPSLLSSQFSNKPLESQGKINMADFKRSDLNDTNGSSLFATAGQKTVAKIENSRHDVFLQGENSQATTESPKAEVRYIVLQPGQKMSDLLPLTSGQDSGHNSNQPHLVYLGHLKAPPPSMNVLPQPLKIQSTRTDNQLPHPVVSAPSLCPPVQGSDSDSIPNNRPKDVVPGTEDKYRTPGSSFLNKKGNIKRPMNAFMVWARNYRSKLASRFHSDTNSQISIKLGDVWNSLTPEEKQPFYEEAERIKNQHRKEFPGWVYRPAITKRRQEEPESQQAQQAHQMLWARFAGGSSAATLAAMATAAANQTPLQPVPAKQELLPHATVKQEESAARQQDPTKPGCELPQPVNPQKAQEQTEEKQTSTCVEQTSLHRVNEGQTKGQASSYTEPNLQKPTTSTQEVLKAKLCSHSLQKPQLLKGEAISTTNTKPASRASKSHSKSQKNGAKPKDQKHPLKGSKERVPRGPLDKKKKTTASKGATLSQSMPGIDRKEPSQYNLDLRSRSPVTPPSTPRTTGTSNGSEDAVEEVALVNRMTSQLGTGSTQSASDWTEMNCSADDTLARSLIQPRHIPFTPLSPRDVPSDEILGTGRRVRGCSESEDLSRPERVTSDIYLDLDSWTSYLTSSESASKLTDDEVCIMFDPKKCKHGDTCTVCTSDLDLAPKPVRETLQVRRDPAQSSQEVALAQSDNQQVDIDRLNMLLDDPSVCVEVDLVERKPQKSDNIVDDIVNSVFKTLIESCDTQGTFNKPSKDSRAEHVSKRIGKTCTGGKGSREQKQTDSSKAPVDRSMLKCSTGSSRRLDISDGLEDNLETDVHISANTVKSSVTDIVSTDASIGESSESEETSVAMDTDSEPDAHPESHGVRFVDVTLSTNKSTHVRFKGDHSGQTANMECGTKPKYCSTCIGCSLNINHYQALQDELDKSSLKSRTPLHKRSESPEPRARETVCKTGPPAIIRPTSRQVYKTDDNSRGGDSVLAPEVIPLSRSMDQESQSRCEMYHRKMQVPTDISKYKIFDTNRSAKSRGRRLKSAQLVRDGESMKLGVFGEEIVGQSISSGNMTAQPVPVWRRVEIDELDELEGIGIKMERRLDVQTGSRSNKLSPRKSACLSEEGRHTRGKKKTARSRVQRVSDESESDLCQGDSVKGSSDSNPDSPGSQMELLRTILGRQGEKERGWKDTSFSPALCDQFAGSRYRKSRMRRHVTSKIYVAQQTLPELPKKKSNGRGRSSRSKITRTDNP